jgi:hypothetical protein
MSAVHQLECPELVNTIPEICYLHMKLLGEKFLWPLKIVEGFIVTEWKNLQISYILSVVTLSPNP